MMFIGAGSKAGFGSASMTSCAGGSASLQAVAPATSPPCWTANRSKSVIKGGVRGYDAGKKVTGRKRHILVDVQGLLLGVYVGPADEQDRDGARTLLRHCVGWYGKLTKIWADGGYAGELVAWVKALRPRGRLHLDIVQRPADQVGFKVLPRRWVVERTVGWFVKQRRLVRDYEAKPEHAEAMLYIAMTTLMLRRLTSKRAK
jgi:transposase